LQVDTSTQMVSGAKLQDDTLPTHMLPKFALSFLTF